MTSGRDKLDLILQAKNQISVSNAGYFHVPKIYDIIDYEDRNGIDSYNALVFPFRLSTYHFEIEDKTQKYYPFLFADIIGNYTGERIGINFLQALKFYFKCDIKIDIHNYQVFLGEIFDNDGLEDFKMSGVINNDNFEELRKLVLTVNHTDMVELEKPPNFTNERQKDVYEKTMAGRKREAIKNAIYLEDMINYIATSPRNTHNHQSLLNENIYTFHLIYKSDTVWELFSSNWDKYLAGADPKKDKLDLAHPLDKLKIRKLNKE